MQYRHTNYDMTDKHIWGRKSLMLVDKRTEVSGLSCLSPPDMTWIRGFGRFSSRISVKNDFINGQGGGELSRPAHKADCVEFPFGMTEQRLQGEEEVGKEARKAG